MSSRAVGGNWLRAYQEYVKESESPESFHLWTGLSVLASVLRRRIWLDMGLFEVYPHLFVILVAPPGKVAKSTTIRLGRNLLYGVPGIEFGPDSVTREELIRIMGKLGEKHKSASVTIHSTELSSLIEPSGVKMIQFLTDIYDGDVRWQYATKHEGSDDIKKPVLNLLAATTPSWIAEGLPASVVGHGFTSRVIFVYDDEPRFLNPFPEGPPGELEEALIEDLKAFCKMSGEFVFTPEARAKYTEFYHEIFSSMPEDYRVEGYHYRKRTHLLKVSMLLSVAERDTQEILPQDVESAWALLRATEGQMYKTFSAVGKFEHATDLERILSQIEHAGERGLSGQEIYSRNYAVGDQRQIAGLLQMMMNMGRIFRTKQGDVSFYISTSHIAE